MRNAQRAAPRRLALALVGLVVAGCSDRAGEPVAAGLDADDRELAEFLGDLHQSARSLPESGSIRGRLAMAYDANGFFDAATVTYSQAEALDPGEFLWPYCRAFLLAGRGTLKDALQSIDRALAIDADYAPAWLQRGTWLLDLDRNQDAAASFRRALALGDAEAKVVANAGLARILLRERRATEAAALLESLVAELDHPHLQRLLGQAYREMGRTDEAQAATARGKGTTPLRWRDERREAKDQYAHGFHARLSMAEAHLKRGQAAAAAKILEPLREQRPDDRTLLNNLSIAYKLTGRREHALEVLRQGLQTHPDHYLFHFNIASLYEDRGQPLRAIEHFGRAAQLYPGLLDAYERKGMLLIRQQRYDEALATFDAMSPYGERAVVLYYMAMIEGASERWPAAIAYLEQAVRLDPEFTKGYVSLGRSLAETGRFDEAQAALARAEQLGTHPRDVASARTRLAVLDREL